MCKRKRKLSQEVKGTASPLTGKKKMLSRRERICINIQKGKLRVSEFLKELRSRLLNDVLKNPYVIIPIAVSLLIVGITLYKGGNPTLIIEDSSPSITPTKQGFDFINNTYSGILTILATLFGLSYPLIISSIEKIDSKYNSTLLSARFRREKVFKWFRHLLILNLGIALLFPFLMNENPPTTWFIVIQAISTIAVISLALKLYSLILDYYDPAKLRDNILREYDKVQRQGDKKGEEKHFAEWTELTDILLRSEDKTLVESVYKTLEKYVEYSKDNTEGEKSRIETQKARQEYKYTEKPYDDYFYHAILRINETICRNERKPFEIKYSIPRYLLPMRMSIPQKSFVCIEKVLKTILFYNREDLIIEYWKVAHTKAGYLIYNKDPKKEEFLFLHIVLCAILLHKKRYSTIQQILRFSLSDPPNYHLIPSKLSEIIQAVIQLRKKLNDAPNGVQERIPLVDTYGVEDGHISKIVYTYLAFLPYRLYNTNIWQPHCSETPLSTPPLPDKQNELAFWEETVRLFLFYINRIEQDKKLLAIIGIDDFLETLKTLSRTRRKHAHTPKMIFEILQRDIKEKISTLIENQEYDSEIIKDIKGEVQRRITKKQEAYTLFQNEESTLKKESPQLLNSPIVRYFENDTFQANSLVGHFGLGGDMAGTAVKELYNTFPSLCYNLFPKRTYNLSSTSIFSALDKLHIGKEHIVISFGIYWDWYMEKTEGFKQKSGCEYNYKGVQIINLKCSNQVFSQSICVMRREDMPYLSCKVPNEKNITKYKLECIDEKYQIWMSILKIKDNKELVSPEDLQKLGEEADKMSLFSLFWLPQLHTKPNAPMVRFNIKYKSFEDTHYINVEDLEPFESDEQANNAKK